MAETDCKDGDYPATLALIIIFSIIGGLILLFVIFCSCVACYFHCKKKGLRRKWGAMEKDVVVLHRFPNGKYCPNLSPFVIKVESFLRAADIKYVNDFKDPMGSRQLCPSITVNGEDVCDSQMIIDFLSKKYNKNFDAHLSPERKAVVEMARIMVEEYMYWIVVLHRNVHQKIFKFLETQEFPGKMWHCIFKYAVPDSALKRGKAQGIARHTEQQQFEMYKNCISYLDTVLGHEKYFGGDKMCTADFSIYGLLMQLKYNTPGSNFEIYFKDFPRLDHYCVAMKQELYPDWDSQLSIPAKEEQEKEKGSAMKVAPA